MRCFINRDAEVGALRARLARDSSLSLVYGQRRIGKTYLLQHLVRQDQDARSFLADESSSQALLGRFAEQCVGAPPGVPSGAAPSMPDWSTALELMLREARADGRRAVLVIDECQYLFEAEPALPSILQRLWDEYHERMQLHVILCGSALGVLARLGGSGQPLHGRFDLKLKLEPFSFMEAALFAAEWSAVDRMLLYGVFGGLARHLAYVDPGRSLADNVAAHILDPLATLHDAAHDILRSERISSQAHADAVLSAIGRGETRFNTIASRCGLTASRLNYVRARWQRGRFGTFRG